MTGRPSGVCPLPPRTAPAGRRVGDGLLRRAHHVEGENGDVRHAIRPPKHPSADPMAASATRAPVTMTTAPGTEIRAPYRTRLSASRPAEPGPGQYSAGGRGSGAPARESGSARAITGAGAAIDSRSRMRSAPITADGHGSGPAGRARLPHRVGRTSEAPGGPCGAYRRKRHSQRLVRPTGRRARRSAPLEARRSGRDRGVLRRCPSAALRRKTPRPRADMKRPPCFT